MSDTRDYFERFAKRLEEYAEGQAQMPQGPVRDAVTSALLGVAQAAREVLEETRPC
jgi:hypothetical protein